MPVEPDFPTDAMIEIATRHSTQCLAAIGREMIKGHAGWKYPADPTSYIREAIIAALMEAVAQRRDAEAKSRA